MTVVTVSAAIYAFGELSHTALLSLLLSLLFSMAISAVAYHEKTRGRFDLFHPILFSGFLFFFPNFVLKTWIIILSDAEEPIITKLWNPDHSILLALIVGLVAYGCLILGYYRCPFKDWARRQLLKFKSQFFSFKTIPLPSMVLFLTGIGCSYYLLATGQGVGYTDVQEVGPFMNVLQHISKFNLYALFIFLYAYLLVPGGNLAWKMEIAFIISCQFTLGFIIGSRGYLFLTGLVVTAAMQYSGYFKVKPTRVLKVGGLLVLLLFLGMIFVTSFRQIKYKYIGFDQPYSMKESWFVYREAIRSENINNLSQALTYFGELITVRLNNMTSLASVLERADKVKDIEIAYGINSNMLQEFLWGLVPRFLYPNKPILSDFALKFGIIYRDNPVSMRSWSNPTIIGDLYRNARYPGIIIGMIFLGMFLRLMYIALVERVKNLFSFMAFTFSILNMNLEGTFIGVFHGLIRLWIMMAVFYTAFLLIKSLIFKK